MATVGGERETARRGGVDAGRFLAFIAVCFVHTARWGQPQIGADAVAWLTLACRFCVPFFFLASGYFTGGRGGLSATLTRIGAVFAVWAIVYVALTPGGAGRLLHPRFLALTLIDGGPGFHLWFLPALATALVVAWMLRGRPSRWRLLAMIAALMLGWLAADFGTDRPTVYAGRYLTATGYVLAGTLCRQAPSEALQQFPPTRLAGLIAFGFGGEAVEALLLSALRLRPVSEVEFPLGAAAVSLGLFLAALAWTPRSALARLASVLGRRTLGLYAVHLGVAMLLFEVLPFVNLAERLAVFVLTVLGSIACTEGLRRTPLRRLVQ